MIGNIRSSIVQMWVFLLGPPVPTKMKGLLKSPSPLRLGPLFVDVVAPGPCEVEEDFWLVPILKLADGHDVGVSRWITNELQ